MSIYQHILLATDLTDASLEAQQTAVKLAACLNAKLSLLHIIDPIPVYACGYMGMVDFSERLDQEAHKELSALAKDLGIAETQIILEKGTPKLQIVDIAKRVQADLIITGSHGRHGIALLLGSTATGVLHGAQCDVLVVRHRE